MSAVKGLVPTIGCCSVMGCSESEKLNPFPENNEAWKRWISRVHLLRGYVNNKSSSSDLLLCNRHFNKLCYEIYKTSSSGPPPMASSKDKMAAVDSGTDTASDSGTDTASEGEDLCPSMSSKTAFFNDHVYSFGQEITERFQQESKLHIWDDRGPSELVYHDHNYFQKKVDQDHRNSGENLSKEHQGSENPVFAITVLRCPEVDNVVTPFTSESPEKSIRSDHDYEHSTSEYGIVKEEEEFRENIREDEEDEEEEEPSKRKKPLVYSWKSLQPLFLRCKKCDSPISNEPVVEEVRVSASCVKGHEVTWSLYS